MVELYQLRWSHYVEKVRWALDFKGLPWQAIDIVAFRKQEMKRFPCAQMVPLIHDTSTGAALSDSSPIIRHLDEAYPQRRLLPDDPVERERAWQWMLRLDSTLGLYARRLGYTQLIMECPQALPRLFMTQPCGGLFTRRGWRSLAAPVLGMMLTKRFRFDRNRKDGIYERLESLLLPLSDRLERDAHVLGESFGAVDITLASLLRPLRIVPHFSHHPRLQGLFAWQQRLFRRHGRDMAYPYEAMIEAHRQESGAMKARVRWMEAPIAAPMDVDQSRTRATNDQHSVNGLSLFQAWPGYLKLRWFSDVGKQDYSPAPYLAF